MPRRSMLCETTISRPRFMIRWNRSTIFKVMKSGNSGA